MADAFRYPLCKQLCQPNQSGPNSICPLTIVMIVDCSTIVLLNKLLHKIKMQPELVSVVGTLKVSV